MKKILVVFTGGTIGSRIHNDTIDVDVEAVYSLIKLFQDQYNYDVEFETIMPLNILSENATPKHWKLLNDAMKHVDRSRYQGIIVTHGSDTLSYTSAVLSLLFCDTQIPIVITASNYALECDKSNGLINFKSSIDFIESATLPGVFTVYQNDLGQNIVYLASRIMESEPYNDQFFSFGGDYFGEIIEGVFCPKISKINPSLDQIAEKRPKLIVNDITFSQQILAIRPYPGQDYENFNLTKKPKAILHSLYHSATACTVEDNYSLPKFIQKCRDEGIDFYLISFKNIDQDLYKSSRDILEHGAVPLQNISFEAAYAKLNIAYNQTELPPLEYMNKGLFYEFLPK